MEIPSCQQVKEKQDWQVCECYTAHAYVKGVVGDQIQLHKSGKQTRLQGIRPAEKEDKTVAKCQKEKTTGERSGTKEGNG